QLTRPDALHQGVPDVLRPLIEPDDVRGFTVRRVEQQQEDLIGMLRVEREVDRAPHRRRAQGKWQAPPHALPGPLLECVGHRVLHYPRQAPLSLRLRRLHGASYGHRASLPGKPLTCTISSCAEASSSTAAARRRARATWRSTADASQPPGAPPARAAARATPAGPAAPPAGRAV